MLDNLTLPPPPTATRTPIYYRYSFYNIPFSKDGEDVALPEAVTEKDIAMELHSKNYLKYEVITNRAFRSEQESVIIPQTIQLNDIAYNVNYCRVAAVRDEQTELYEYTYDLNANYYWIDNAEFLSVMDGFIKGAIQFDISKDYIMTHFMIGREKSKPTITGNVEVTNDIAFNDNINVKSLIEANYKGASTLIDTIIDAYTPYALIICYTDKASVLFAEAIKCNEGRSTANPYDTYLNLIECVELASKSASVKLEAADFGAISVKKIYALPLEWIEDKIDITSVGQKETDTGLKLYSFNNLQKLHNNGNAIYIYDRTPKSYPLNIYDKYFLRMPSRQIELTGNPLSRDFFDFKIFIDMPVCGQQVAATGSATDTIVFNLYINGEYIDISDVFSIDFAVNEGALRQNQFKELTALESVAAVVGGIGGVAGGVASGNYFGAIQAAVGGVEKIGSIASVGKQPAQLRNAGSFTNGLIQYGLLSFLVFQSPTNVVELQKVQKKYGWSHTTITPVEISTFLNGNYYKLTNVSVTNLPRCGETAAAIIAARFEQGIRFKEL